MPIKIKSSGGGSVSLDVPNIGTDTTLTLPTFNATLVSNTSPTLTGNVAVSGANSFININGNNISPYSGMMKNRFINGDFRIDQRFAGTANINFSGSQYVVDRWWQGSGGLGGKMRFQQNNTDGPGSAATQAATGFSYYFGANVVSSNTVSVTDYVFLSQIIEGFNIADLAWGTANASPVTLSFWSYSSVPGTHGGTITSGIDSTAYPFTYTINTANTWQHQKITISGPTSGTFFSNNSAGLVVYFISGAIGTNYTRSNTFTWAATSRSWPTDVVNVVSSANGSFYLTGVQLEKGSQATAFDFRHYTTELQLCQRYCYVGSLITTGQCDSAGNPTVSVQLPVTPRAIPSLVNYSGSWRGAILGTITNLSVAAWDVNRVILQSTQSGSVNTLLSGASGSVNYTFSSELGTQN